jgi:hypothetical protein
MVHHRHPALNVVPAFFGAAVTHSRKPIEIIREELWDHDDPDTASEDIVAALEDAGWHFVFMPDDGGVAADVGAA